MSEVTPKDRKYMRWCVEGAKLFSTCAKAQYMAIVIDAHGHVIGTGYNGGPKGYPHCDEGACPRLAQTTSGGSYTNCIAIHAEANAILHSDYTHYRDGATLVVNGVPCWDCAKLLSNSGIRRVVYLEDGPVRELDRVRRLLEECAVQIIAVTPEEIGLTATAMPGVNVTR